MSAFLNSQHLDALAHKALEHYPFTQEVQARLHTLSENATYYVHSGRKAYALRIHRNGYHSDADILSELAWIDALGKSGIEVPEILRGQDGEWLQQIQVPGVAPHSVVMFGWIEGEEPGAGQLRPVLKRLGQITSELHQQARQWQRPAGFTRPSWTTATMIGEEGLWGRWREAPYLGERGIGLIDDTVAALAEQTQAWGRKPERTGLIHADLRFTNLLVAPQHTRIIDFDDCGMGFYLHDLAATVSFHETDPALPGWLEAWLEGYTETTHLSDAELAMVPTLIMRRRLQLLAWSASHKGAPQADSLGRGWTDDTLALCQRYLAGRPVGALV